VSLNNMKRKQGGFTFVEVLVVLGIIMVLAVLGILLINPKSQIEKSWDVRRKTDISMMEKKFEDYYNDNDSYPNEVACIDEPVNDGDSCTCHICGFKKAGIISYLNTQNCDPEYPRKTYLYRFDCSTEKPQWYEICAALKYPVSNDKPADTSYNFGVSSPNRKFSYCFSNCVSDEVGFKYCFKTSSGQPICNGCGTYAECILESRCDYPITLYNNSSCTDRCVSSSE